MYENLVNRVFLEVRLSQLCKLGEKMLLRLTYIWQTEIIVILYEILCIELYVLKLNWTYS